MSALDDLLGNVIESETSTEETTHSISTSPQGEIVSTCTITFKTVRDVRRRYMTDLPDEKIAALIERANAMTLPLIQKCSGQELEEMVVLYGQVVSICQNLLNEHARNAYKLGAPTKATKKELEELAAKRTAEKEARLNREIKKGKRISKQIARAESNDKMPIWEKLTRSSDPLMRTAGKTIKQSVSMGVAEEVAIKFWNTQMATSNPAALILNVDGKRLDIVMEKKGK